MVRDIRGKEKRLDLRGDKRIVLDEIETSRKYLAHTLIRYGVVRFGNQQPAGPRLFCVLCIDGSRFIEAKFEASGISQVPGITSNCWGESSALGCALFAGRETLASGRPKSPK